MEDLVDKNGMLGALANGGMRKSVYFKFYDGKDFKFGFVNDIKAHNSGVSPKEMVGKKDSDFMSFEDAAIAYDEDMRAYNGEVVECIKKITRLDGTMAYVSTTKTPWKDAQGNLFGILGVSEDITRRMEVEELVKVEIHSILHDLKNILIGHGGFMGMLITFLKKGKIERCLSLLPSKKDECLLYEEKIKIMNMRIAQLGLEKPQLPETNTVFDLRDIFDRLMDRHREKMNELGIQWDDFMGLIPPGKYILNTVMDWIAFAIDSVIDNQIKYGETITRLTFGAEINEQQNQLIINVSSDGVRINEEFARTKLFKKGQRCMETCHKEGTGFGLYTAREYIRSLGGEMEYVPVMKNEFIEDEWMGFLIILPLDVLQDKQF